MAIKHCIERDLHTFVYHQVLNYHISVFHRGTISHFGHYTCVEPLNCKRDQTHAQHIAWLDDMLLSRVHQIVSRWYLIRINHCIPKCGTLCQQKVRTKFILDA